jgi:hypothetical protein
VPPPTDGHPGAAGKAVVGRFHPLWQFSLLKQQLCGDFYTKLPIVIVVFPHHTANQRIALAFMDSSACGPESHFTFNLAR